MIAALPAWLVVGAVVVQKFKPHRDGHRFRVLSVRRTSDPFYPGGWKVEAERLFPRPNGKPWKDPARFTVLQLAPAEAA